MPSQAGIGISHVSGEVKSTINGGNQAGQARQRHGWKREDPPGGPDRWPGRRKRVTLSKWRTCQTHQRRASKRKVIAEKLWIWDRGPWQTSSQRSLGQRSSGLGDKQAKAWEPELRVRKSNLDKAEGNAVVSDDGCWKAHIRLRPTKSRTWRKTAQKCDFDERHGSWTGQILEALRGQGNRDRWSCIWA